MSKLLRLQLGCFIGCVLILIAMTVQVIANGGVNMLTVALMITFLSFEILNVLLQKIITKKVKKSIN